MTEKESESHFDISITNVYIADKPNTPNLYLQFAYELARDAYEKEHEGERGSQILPQGPYVTGTVVNAVAALEVSINDIIKEMEIESEKSDEFRRIKNLSESSVPFPPRSIIGRYQSILILNDKKTIDTGKGIGQQVKDVIALRNKIVHHSPHLQPKRDMTGPVPDPDQFLGDRFHSKFAKNPLASETDIFFPYKCLSYGCARWSILTCIDFLEKFFNRMEFEPPYLKDTPDKIREGLPDVA